MTTRHKAVRARLVHAHHAHNALLVNHGRLKVKLGKKSGGRPLAGGSSIVPAALVAMLPRSSAPSRPAAAAQDAGRGHDATEDVGDAAALRRAAFDQRERDVFHPAVARLPQRSGLLKFRANIIIINY